MNGILIALLLALLIPIYSAWQSDDIWQKMMAFASVATKTSILMLFISVFRDDWYVGVAAVIVLCLGNAGLMLLAHLIKRLE